MPESSLMNDGLTLMLFGMGFVFLFLTLLVFATHLMSWLMTRYERSVGVIPDEGVPSPATFIPQHGPLISKKADNTDDNTLISILTAAVHKFRSDKK